MYLPSPISHWLSVTLSVNTPALSGCTCGGRAKSLQLFQTLCDPMDCIPPGFSVEVKQFPEKFKKILRQIRETLMLKIGKGQCTENSLGAGRILAGYKQYLSSME